MKISLKEQEEILSICKQKNISLICVHCKYTSFNFSKRLAGKRPPFSVKIICRKCGHIDEYSLEFLKNVYWNPDYDANIS